MLDLPETCDFAIVGGGPAGISAAIYAVRKNLKTALFEGKILGGTTNEAMEVVNYLGFPKVSGHELSEKFVEHLKSFPEIALVEEKVVALSKNADGTFLVKTDHNEFSARSLLLAMGSAFKTLGVAREKELVGRGISYCAVCDAPFFKNKAVGVVGGGDSALKTAAYLAETAAQVHLIHRRDSFRAEEAQQKVIDRLVKSGKIKLHLKRVVKELAGEKFLSGVVLQEFEGTATEELPLNGLFVYVGNIPLSVLAGPLGVELDERGFVKTGENGETSVPGVYAAGDITGRGMQYVTAAAGGAYAALAASSFVKKNYPE